VSMSKSVGVVMLDGSEWGFVPLARVKKGIKAREGLPFNGGLSWVEIVRGIGLSVAYSWGDRVTGHDVHGCKLQSEGRTGKGSAKRWNPVRRRVLGFQRE
jgi:hypothetical protein